MADEVNAPWDSEDIPDSDLLYVRIHQRWFFPDGTIQPGAFRNQPTPQDGMSTDWQKYARPEETRYRARTPQDNAIIQLVAAHVRRIPDQTIVHTPDLLSKNRAHTDVFGEKHPEARLKYCRLYKIVIPIDSKIP